MDFLAYAVIDGGHAVFVAHHGRIRRDSPRIEITHDGAINVTNLDGSPIDLTANPDIWRIVADAVAWFRETYSLAESSTL